MTDYRVTVPEGSSGPWRVDRFTVPENDAKALYYALHGRPVPPGAYTRLMHKGAVVMSDTPAEIRDHLDFILRAKGRVLINGLGLGVVVKALLAKEDVTRVDVVEIDPDVIALVAPTYAPDPRFHLYHSDAFTVKWLTAGGWDYAWHDIWATLCSAHLPEMTRLKRKYSRRVGWQDCWAEATMRQQKRYGY